MSNLKKIMRIVALMAVDAVIVFLSFVVSLFLSFNSLTSFNHSEELKVLLYVLPIFVAIYLIVFSAMNFYRTIWHYAGVREMSKIGMSSIIATIICFLSLFIFTLYNNDVHVFNLATLPNSVYITVPFFVFTLVTLERYTLRLYMRKNNRSKSKTRSEVSGNILIIGAGDAACLLYENIITSDYYAGARIVGFIDDDPKKHGLLIHGSAVLGTRQDIVRIAKEKQVDIIIFSIPSCPAEEKSKILKICQKTECRLKTLNNIYQIQNYEHISTKDVRNVEIEDLLGREPIRLDVKSVMDYVMDKTVLVTGGGGSIGSELCRQIAANKPKRLIILDIYENNAYDIQNELKTNYPELDLVVLIGSVRDSRRVDHLFETYRPQIVYHAAAHKHVPLMEDSPNEAIKNNVFGTLKTVRAADKYGVERFILISTDKAVNPTNIMGASKRMCEMIVQAYNKLSSTDYVAVRFGNVLGSNGSVVPLFKRQIAYGGPVTVTDPSIIRYFMTIPEAVSLVLQAGAQAKGGEIFVLDMGEPVKIVDLAENLIRLSGFTPYVDIDIKFTGLRPGEKKYEELLMSEEGLQQTENKLIYIGKPIEFDEKEFINSLDEYKDKIYDDSEEIRDWVKHFVPTYKINNK